MKKKTFEQLISELEDLTEKIENDNLELEKFVEYYQKADKLIKNCEDILSKAKQKITHLN